MQFRGKAANGFSGEGIRRGFARYTSIYWNGRAMDRQAGRQAGSLLGIRTPVHEWLNGRPPSIQASQTTEPERLLCNDLLPISLGTS